MDFKKIKHRILCLQILTLMSAAALVFSCTNGRMASSSGTNLSSSTAAATGNGINNLIVNFNQFTIANVNVSGSSDSNGYPVTIQFVSQAGSPLITSDCTTGGLPCLCKYTWKQVNQGVNVNRVVYTNLLSVQGAAVSCDTPPTNVWLDEIPTNTTVGITVVPAAGNNKQFTVNTYNYLKGQNQLTGNFSDNQGNSYVNILRYACYEQVQKGVEIASLTGSGSDGGPSFPFPIANQFCYYNSQPQLKQGAAQGGSCGNLSANGQTPFDFSAESNYFNFYIRSSESGDINPGNSLFTCPTVQQSLENNGNQGSQGRYWPLDSSFALSLAATATFNVGVEANTKTFNPGDPTSQNSSCGTTGASPSPTGTSTTTTTNSQIVSSCLGFAAPPQPNGTCPTFANADGSPLYTYRLRRYIGLYPPVYDTGGQLLNLPQQVDTIYVVDRPVTGPNGLNYTMLGPKPCPFAYFDKKGVTGSTEYLGTSNASWTGKNVDGVEFPNTDSATSCAAALPVASADGTKISIETVQFGTHVYIRPVDAWAPHYMEDTGFKACTPLSNPFQDPPLHMAKAFSGNVSWCAEAYPTQNNNITKLDPNKTGAIQLYTSHVVKGVPNAVNCAADTNLTYPGGYPTTSPDIERHPSTSVCDPASGGTCDKTCDRTALAPGNGISWAAFPMLAPPADVERALTADSSFGCLLTFDNSGAANGGVTKVNVASPSQGCCGLSTNVWTGRQGSPRNASSAHLEPNPVATLAPSCSTPVY